MTTSRSPASSPEPLPPATGEETEAEIRERCRRERATIVRRYDRGRDAKAHIDDWEDPKLELFHTQDRYGFIQ